MNRYDYRSFVISLEEIFASLYLLNVGSMTAVQRAEHQRALTTAYIAMLAAQNRELSTLNNAARATLDQLSSATMAMQVEVEGMKKTSKVLEVATAGLNILTSVTKLLA